MPRSAPNFASSCSLATPSNLSEISCQLEPLTGKLPLEGRCHRLPRRLEHDYSPSSKVLGSGYNGNVYLARSRINTKQTVAVKSFRLTGLSESKKESLKIETSIFLCMDHPHIARLLDVYESDSFMSLVMECMEGGELFDRVTSVKQFTEPQAADATRQMLLALCYLHSHGMVHRDVKLENFLYDCQSGDHLKMIDFGFSKFCDTKGRMRTSCGTLAYVAPEVLDRSYTSQCDLWSIGVIVFILLSGRMPFSGNSDQQVMKIKQGKCVFKPEHWAFISPAAQNFVKALLEVDPYKRLTAKMALDHAWLKQSFKAPRHDSRILDALRSWSSSPKLYRACMSMMAWSLTNKHHAQVRDHFLALDKDHDGVISLEELKDALEKNGCNRSEIYQAFDLLSQGHDDKIHYSDFLAAMVGTHLEVDDHLCQVAFKKFDRHGSGFICSEDLRAILGSSIQGDDIGALIREGDQNGDGKLDFSEFQSYVRSSRTRSLTQQNAIQTKNLDLMQIKSQDWGTTTRISVPASRNPVLLGHTSAPFAANAAAQKGRCKGSPFSTNAEMKEVEVEEVEADEVQARKPPPACCIVQ